VKAYKKDGTAYAGDSREPQSEYKLPAYVEISLVLIDSATSRRIEGSAVAAIRALYPAATDAATFIAQLPKTIRGECTSVSTVVNLSNCK
jgi:hypothetical protein